MKKKLNKPTAFVIILVLALVLGACSARDAASIEPGKAGAPLAEGEVWVEQDLAIEMAADAAPAAAPAEQSAGVNVGGGGFNAIAAPNVQDRVLIKNANLSLVVSDPVAAIQMIGSIAENSGGFVVSSNLSSTVAHNGQEVPTGNITIRVPSESFAHTLNILEAEAIDVQNKSVTGKDVTLEYTDLQSRLRNLEDAAEQLRAIMAEAHRTEDVLAVYNQLTYVTEQAEVIRGQLQYFSESAAFSAISINLIAEATIQPITVAGWQPAGVARDAIQALVNTLQMMTTSLIWFSLYRLPVLLIYGVPLWLVFLFVRAQLRRRWTPEAQSTEA